MLVDYVYSLVCAAVVSLDLRDRLVSSLAIGLVSSIHLLCPALIHIWNFCEISHIYGNSTKWLFVLTLAPESKISGYQCKPFRGIKFLTSQVEGKGMFLIVFFCLFFCLLLQFTFHCRRSSLSTPHQSFSLYFLKCS